MSSQIRRESKILAAYMLRTQLPNSLVSNSDKLVGEVDILPIGYSSVFLESEDGVDLAVKEPEIHPGSVNVVVTASDLLEASSSSNAQFPPASSDCPPVDVIDVDLGAKLYVRASHLRRTIVTKVMKS